MNIDIIPLTLGMFISLFVLLLTGLPIAFVTGTIACIVAGS